MPKTIGRATTIHDYWYSLRLAQFVDLAVAVADALAVAAVVAVPAASVDAAVDAAAGLNSSRTSSGREPIPSQCHHRLQHVGTRMIVPHGSSSRWMTSTRRGEFPSVVDIAEDWTTSPRHDVAAVVVVFVIEAADV